MPLVIAMTHLVTALTFSIQIMLESCPMVFIDLKRIKYDKPNFQIQQKSRLESATEFALP